MGIFLFGSRQHFQFSSGQKVKKKCFPMHRFSPGVLPSRVMINVNELVPFNPIFLDARCISRGICHSKISQMKKYLEDYQRQPLQCQCKVYKLCSFFFKLFHCFVLVYVHNLGFLNFGFAKCPMPLPRKSTDKCPTIF